MAACLKQALTLLTVLLLSLPTACGQPDTVSAGGTGGDSSSPVQSTESGSLSASGSANHTLYVLMYHTLQTDEQPCNAWTLTKDRFREDLEWLSANGWTTVLPSELAAGTPLPEKAVLITFDDGYSSNYWLAYPLLKEYQSKAVISVIASYVDAERPYYMTWGMCKDLVQSGLVEIGSHTYNLHDETGQGIRRRKEETQADYESRVFPDLQTSIDLIEEKTGVKPLLFAHPYGNTDSWADQFLRDHFSVTVTSHSGKTNISKGLYDMNRFNVSMDTPLSKILPS